MAYLRFKEAAQSPSKVPDARNAHHTIIDSIGEKGDQIMASILIQPFPRIESMLMLPLASSQVYDLIAKSIA